MDNNYKLYVLGTRGTRSVFGKQYEEFGCQTSCYIFKCSNHAVILDCGTGLYNADNLLRDCNKVDIILTHIHYDHFLGLTKASVFNKDAEVTIYGTISKWFNNGDLNELFLAPFWPVKILNYKTVDIKNDGTLIKLNENVSFKLYPSNHPNSTSVVCLLFGNKKIVMMSDYEYNGLEGLDFISDSDMLFYDGMYDIDDYDSHVGWGHSTWQNAVDTADKYNVKQVLIVHHNPDYNDEKLLEMEKACKKEFANSRFVRVNDIYNI